MTVSGADCALTWVGSAPLAGRQVEIERPAVALGHSEAGEYGRLSRDRCELKNAIDSITKLNSQARARA